MTRLTALFVVALLVLREGSSCLAREFRELADTNSPNILSVTVSGEAIPIPAAGRLRLKPFPKNLSFTFGRTNSGVATPGRLRYRLEGHEAGWREDAGEMSLNVRWFDEAGDQINQEIFAAKGESTGWKGSLDSPMTHRREALVVPPRAARFWIVISSAGPPNSVGIFVVDGLTISRQSPDGSREVLMRPPFERPLEQGAAARPPEGWIRDGARPSMARIVDLGQNPPAAAFAILDDDAAGHAEWHNIMEIAPRVKPGEHLVVEWNEMFSVGLGNSRTANYDTLPAGAYHFRVAAATPTGVPTGLEASLEIFVPPPYWKEPWFWGLTCVAAAFLAVAGARSVVRYRLRQAMGRLENQRAMEQERLRIAHDIHDDLGARVTQISLLSALAHDNPAFPEKARATFDQISRMSRDLVAALYETVWAVNPENDNLDALGNYLCQMANQLCDPAQLSCRLYLEDLPREIRVSSQTRHNISLAVKEAVHNVIKHARASEVSLRIALEALTLTVSVQDDGAGFDPARSPAGNGLHSMKRRLEGIGGTCEIVSRPGEGATVRLRLVIKPLD